MGFNYGAEPVSGGKSFKNPEVGKHQARLRSIIHLGLFQETFQGKLKDVAPQVVAVFELKEDHDFEEDGTTPLTFSKTFPLRTGEKSFLTKMEKVFMQPGDTGFESWIGRVCELDLKGSKELGEDKKPKYINFDIISSLHPKLAAICPELAVQGSGHCEFANLTVDAIKELHPIREVADILLSQYNQSYAGSHVEKLIAEIRKDNPTFAVRKASDDKPQQAEPEGSTTPAPSATPPAQLDEDESF